jgi:hypothetical protein
MVGKTAKSKGRKAYTTTNKTINDSAILKVKNISNKKGGNGNTSIANITIIKMGAPKPFRAKSNNSLEISLKFILHHHY